MPAGVETPVSPVLVPSVAGAGVTVVGRVPGGCGVISVSCAIAPNAPATVNATIAAPALRIFMLGLLPLGSFPHRKQTPAAICSAAEISGRKGEAALFSANAFCGPVCEACKAFLMHANFLPRHGGEIAKRLR
jgi:hypothetical protein